ncbi:RanGTP-binding protein [Phlyctema vagabunda]|uniref:RanGTP-binding protein n=1 Tax=Phlyctema vagabunda TaxID=108571 RepID=A0ABR4PFC6_9HELO
MDAFLGKITHHAMNYAIRSGIAITASYTIRQTTRLLKTVEDGTDYQELHDLQRRLNDQIKVISPSIDMIELISARGNTTLESAVTLTKALRWDIQSLGIRLAKAAAAEEESRQKRTKAKSRAAHQLEISLIVKDIKKLLTRIEDAVPLISLAITTSGARLSTALPSTVSPSRLLQASTFLTAGDTQYSMNPNSPMQIGPTFTLTLYMLFAGHAYREHVENDNVREMTWKEVIHKARVRLMRVPLRPTTEQNLPSASADSSTHPVAESIEKDSEQEPIIAGDRKVNEFAYHIELIEDFDDGRVHSFEDDSPQPTAYEDIELAGIRESVPIHQISKIFYASTGKILNIGEGETNSPVLLLKRDVSALPPRRMMQDNEQDDGWDFQEDVEQEAQDNDSQDDIDEQIRRESSVPAPEPEKIEPQASREQSISETAWRFPPNLDPEWLALEVYSEEYDEESSLEEGDDLNNDSAYVSHRPSSSGEQHDRESELATDLADLNLEEEKQESSPSTVNSPTEPVKALPQPTEPPPVPLSFKPKPVVFGNIRSSLSLMEMLIRLTALQQFQQASHLAIPDELLTFFLEESSTTGAGGDGDERRRTRRDARRKVGFDPYDESPIKRHGEEYQYQNQYQSQEQYREYSRAGTPYDEHDPRYQDYRGSSPHWAREGTPEPWLLRGRETSSPRRRTESTPDAAPSPPMSPYKPQRKPTNKFVGPLDRVQQERRAAKPSSPLGRGLSVETDSTLGTSPGSPTLVGKREENLI